jgi:single-stranded DNA-specific DHH superfamily exonuclease
MTSSALLINYLYDIFPSWVENHLIWYIHSGKQHGLSDCYQEVLNHNFFNLCICPDSSSEDYQYHTLLKENNITTIVLDHHLAKHDSSDAIVINSQFNNYPNDQLSGVGVTWQFCRYLDALLDKNYANQYLDLVALGLR